MPNYIRANLPGGCYFFTVALLERLRRLLTDNIDALREALHKVKEQAAVRNRCHRHTSGSFVRLGQYPLEWAAPSDIQEREMEWMGNYPCKFVVCRVG